MNLACIHCGTVLPDPEMKKHYKTCEYRNASTPRPVAQSIQSVAQTREDLVELLHELET